MGSNLGSVVYSQYKSVLTICSSSTVLDTGCVIIVQVFFGATVKSLGVIEICWVKHL